jgi:hypothetical protein
MNLNEKQIAGTSWIRAHTIIMRNPFNGDRTVEFNEEKLIQLADGSTISQTAPGIGITFDPNEQVQILDPDTGAAIPGMIMSQGLIMTAIASLYFKKAAERGEVL